jgi:nucleoside-diphosphate-sugar epimerase
MPMTRFLAARAWQDNDRVRTQGSAAVVDAATAASVGRVLQESVAMLYRDHGAGWIDEDTPTELFPRSRANLAAEANANRFTAAGGTGVVLRFGWIYGLGATHSEQLLALARRHLGLVLGAPDGYVSFDPRGGWGQGRGRGSRCAWGTFNVVDDEPLTKREYAAALAHAAGKATWLRVPGRAGVAGWGPPHVADPVAAGEQRAVPLGDRVGAALSQRPPGLDRHRATTRLLSERSIDWCRRLLHVPKCNLP